MVSRRIESIKSISVRIRSSDSDRESVPHEIGSRAHPLCGSQGTRGVTPGTGHRGRFATGRTGWAPGRRQGRNILVAFWKLILPRKEVIQPHVPVRLPCYDFTPLTLHTFDASPPRGLGRRLRVQTTRVV